MTDRPTPWWRNRTKLPLVIFLAIAGYFLWTEHQAHVVEFLPWVLILACVGMHLFMHGKQGHGGGHAHDRGREPPADDADERGHSR